MSARAGWKPAPTFATLALLVLLAFVMASDLCAQTVTITGEHLSWETRVQPWETTVSADVITLNLARRRLISITIPFNELPNLQRLYLRDNQLTALDLPDELPSLQELNLNSNQLTDLVLPTKMSRLNELSVSGNPLQSLAVPADFNLDWLQLFGFAKEDVIRYWPDSLLPDIGLQAAVRAALEKGAGEAITAEELASLTALDVHWTEELNRPKIRSLAGLEGAMNLETLDLRDNAPAALTLPSEWTGLRELNFSGNGLTALTLPSEWTQLETLNLAGNALTELTLPTGLASLAALNLTGNRLKQVAVPLDFNLSAL